MRRYKFLKKEGVYDALNRLRNALLAAKDGNDVEEIINGIFTFDEKMKVGRRILIGEYIREGYRWDEISKFLKVGKTTILSVMRNLEKFPRGFELLEMRKNKVEKDYQSKKNDEIGGSTLIFKKKIYSGVKRKDVKR